MKIVKILPNVAFLSIITAFFCSCAQLKNQSSIVNEKNENHVKFEYKYLHDTVHIRDSSVTSFRNDTIFAERWHVKYLSRAVHDTVRATDTVMVTKIETKEVKIKPTLKEKIGEYMLIFIIFVSLYIIAKIIWKKI